MSAASPAILHVVDTLTTGGAEIFAMRLTQAMREEGRSVSIYVLRSDRIERDQLARLAPAVHVSVAPIPFLTWLIRFDGLLFVLGLSFSVVRWWQIRKLVQHIQNHKVDVLHSHLMTADLVACGASRKTGVPWLATMHGDYFKFANQMRYRGSRIFDFDTHFRQIDQQIRHVVCISEPQIVQWRALSTVVVPEGRISKIYNGYTPLAGSSSNVDAALAKIPEDAFVIGMVARGLREKGWEVMAQAFELLDDPQVWLVLVGDGDYIQYLRSSWDHPRVIFAGNVTNPSNWIARFHLACLPTLYDSESLPNSVVEYLFEGKPVVATDVGEISAMLCAKTDHPAGVVIPQLTDLQEMSRSLTTVLRKFIADKAYCAKLASNALVAANAFKMQQCLEQYFRLYSSIHEQKRRST